MKDNVRFIGIDDAAFNREKSQKTFVFGVVMRGYNLIEGILRTDIIVDGLDATTKIRKMINESKFVGQLKAIILGSSTIGAFNLINFKKLYTKTNIPIISVLSTLPDEMKVKTALKHLSDGDERFKILMSNPPIQEIEYANQAGRNCKTYVQQMGLNNLEDVREILKISSFASSLPECLRIADLIGQSFKDHIIS